TALAAYLQQVAGVRKGDRVAVMLPNVLAFPVVFVAVTKIGAVQVNINPLYTARELEHQLDDAGVEVAVVCGGSMRTFADVVGRSRVRTVLSVGRGDLGVVDAPAGACDALPPGSIALADAIAAGASLTYEPVELDGGDLLLLQYTGGTT
ncbi:AMP-dependent synthetase and ligase, partial [Burkholderia sp. TJI49]